jgi:hypothetical protein
MYIQSEMQAHLFYQQTALRVAFKCVLIPLLSSSMMETDAFQFCSNIVRSWCCVILKVTAITQAIGLVLIDTTGTFFNKPGHSSTIKTRIEASGFV